uniref:NADH:flavin oxidoreductase/NADH oxidase N-terminal domain-containing protein n=1 Tax=Panagrolaimus sp. PS1159 TaxID=55785 RepID=A0AC35EW38_9BILA
MVEIRRYNVSKVVIPTSLAQPLKLRISKKIAKNRFYKPPMSEYTTHFDPDDLKSTGLPTQQLINAYEKWAFGGFGIIVTGAIIMDQMSLNYVPGNMLIGEKEDSLERQKGFEAIAKITKEHDAIILAQLANIEDQQGFYKAETPENQILALERTLWAAKYVYERGFDGILIQFLPAVKDGIVYLELTEKLIETLEKVVRSNIPKEAAFVIGVKLSTAKFEAAGVDYDGFMKVLKKVESCNYDFVELAGGSIEFPIENATSRESLFSNVITSAKSYVPNLSLFATGGFRTVAAMENAVASGSLDGIGLARPAAS